VVHRNGEAPGYTYELTWAGEGQDGSRFVLGLRDPDGTTDTLRGSEGQSAGQVRPPIGVETVGLRGPRKATDQQEECPTAHQEDRDPENARHREHFSEIVPYSTEGHG
jgi:hypothetical protein